MEKENDIVRYVEGRCPECGALNAAAVYDCIENFKNDIVEFANSGYSVRIMNGPVKEIHVEHCPESCPTRQSWNKSAIQHHSSDQVTCPRCEGWKEIRVPVSEEEDGFETCPLCNGNGFLTYEDVFLMNNGQL